jgi:hypothetical protein
MRHGLVKEEGRTLIVVSYLDFVVNHGHRDTLPKPYRLTSFRLGAI